MDVTMFQLRNIGDRISRVSWPTRVIVWCQETSSEVSIWSRAHNVTMAQKSVPISRCSHCELWTHSDVPDMWSPGCVTLHGSISALHMSRDGRYPPAASLATVKGVENLYSDQDEMPGVKGLHTTQDCTYIRTQGSIISECKAWPITGYACLYSVNQLDENCLKKLNEISVKKWR